MLPCSLAVSRYNEVYIFGTMFFKALHKTVIRSRDLFHVGTIFHCTLLFARARIKFAAEPI